MVKDDFSSSLTKNRYALYAGEIAMLPEQLTMFSPVSYTHLDVYKRQKYALMLFDLDFFKIANDRYGHMFGDQVLHEAARKAQKSVRTSDIVARIGGDEFLIFVEYKAEISSVAERIFRSIEGMYQDCLVYTSRCV